MRGIILYNLRHMIKVIIDNYIQWQRDNGLNEEAAEALVREYDAFQMWLYRVLEGSIKWP